MVPIPPIKGTRNLHWIGDGNSLVTPKFKSSPLKMVGKEDDPFLLGFGNFSGAGILNFRADFMSKRWWKWWWAQYFFEVEIIELWLSSISGIRLTRHLIRDKYVRFKLCTMSLTWCLQRNHPITMQHHRSDANVMFILQDWEMIYISDSTVWVLLKL